ANRDKPKTPPVSLTDQLAERLQNRSKGTGKYGHLKHFSVSIGGRGLLQSLLFVSGLPAGPDGNRLPDGFLFRGRSSRLGPPTGQPLVVLLSVVSVLHVDICGRKCVCVGNGRVSRVLVFR
ncbi:hypothetical protein BaRGS_00001187, partial [Batillaria attramentaria]